MRSTRALFASIGVSVSLVAAAALSLFTVSAVIAFGGWSAGMGESAPPPALVFDGTAPTQPEDGTAWLAAAEPVVLRATARSRPRRAASAPAPAASSTAAGLDVVTRRPVVDHAPARTRTAVRPPAATPPPASAPAPTPKPTTGDAVRRVGEDLSSAAQSTGKTLSDLTAPLGPPISAAVAQVLDLVAAVLQRTTKGLGGVLDKTLP